MSADTDTETNTECPTCGRDDFASKSGMRYHHTVKHGESLSKITLSCQRCGNEYEELESCAERSSYCSEDCRYPEKQTLSCERCGDKYKRIPSRAVGSRFCSDECKDGSRESLTCEQCGETYNLPPSQAKNSRFCSRGCLASWQAENRTGEDAPGWKGGKQLLVCEWCGGEYSVRPGRINSRFCSKECQGDWSNKHRRATHRCEQCGEKYTTQLSKSDDSRFCSSECLYEWQSEHIVGENHHQYSKRASVTCGWCGDEYEVVPSARKATSFCSRICYANWRSENISGERHPNWGGGGPWYYGPNWEEQAAKARRRDQYRCQDCGMTESEHLEEYGRTFPVHHITPIREFRDGGEIDHESANALKNLITLCDACHPRWEQMAPLRPDTVQPASD